MSEEEFSRSEDDLFAIHHLVGARYAFRKGPVLEATAGLLRLFPAGWSIDAIRGITRFCQQHDQNVRVLVFRPKPEDLRRRLSQRWPGWVVDIEEYMKEAESFYRQVDSFGIVDTSGADPRGLRCALLDLLVDCLSVALDPS